MTGDQQQHGMRFRLRLVGPIKRSTFQREAPEPVAEALSDVFHWSWTTRLQANRPRIYEHKEQEELPLLSGNYLKRGGTSMAKKIKFVVGRDAGSGRFIKGKDAKKKKKTAVVETIIIT